jgi:hypothetical protein
MGAFRPQIFVRRMADANSSYPALITAADIGPRTNGVERDQLGGAKGVIR